MRAIIEEVPRMAGRDQFLAQRGAASPGGRAARRCSIARSGVKNWTTHDLRRTVATRMADLGILPHVIEQI